MTVTAECQKCGQEQSIEVGKEIEGFRRFECRKCRYKQLVWIKLKTIMVPVVTGYQRM
jgi:DNA-directed RNA polymerase subunit RPC12/RpoP